LLPAAAIVAPRHQKYISPRISDAIDGNSARSETNSSISFAFEIFSGFRETEITFVTDESARS
jgi:hypothetical protein